MFGPLNPVRNLIFAEVLDLDTVFPLFQTESLAFRVKARKNIRKQK